MLLLLRLLLELLRRVLRLLLLLLLRGLLLLLRPPCVRGAPGGRQTSRHYTRTRNRPRRTEISGH